MLYPILRLLCYLWTFKEIADSLADIVEAGGIEEPVSREQAKAIAAALRRLCY